MQISPTTRAMLRLALAVLSLALAAGVWEILARQAPGSPFYIGMLPGPISALRETATVVGLLVLASAWLAPLAARDGEPRRLVATMRVGAIAGLGACVYAAATGMHGMQLGDPHPSALPLFALKHGGLGLVFACLLQLGRRAVFRGPPPNAP